MNETETLNPEPSPLSPPAPAGGPGLTVVIPSRNEGRTWWTVQNVLRTTDVDTEVIVVDDGSDAVNFEEQLQGTAVQAMVERVSSDHAIPGLRLDVTVTRLAAPVGNCYARDLGISRATYPAVMVLDAHCNFWGLDDPHGRGGWASRCVQYAAERPRNLGCAVSVQLREASGDEPVRVAMPLAVGRYWGAHLQETQVTSTKEARILQGVWNRDLSLRAALGYDVDPATARGQRSLPDPAAAPVKIGCLMGGAYVLNRDAYLGSGRVWQYLRTWGTSEPVISVWTWLCGGESELLPLEVGHIYRTGKQDLVPWQSRALEIWWNQLFLGALVSRGDGVEFARWRAHLGKNKGFPGGAEKILLAWLDREAENIEALWALQDQLGGGRTWAGYKAEWCDPDRTY